MKPADPLAHGEDIFIEKGGKIMDVFQTFIGTLDKLLNEVLLMEQKFVLGGKFQDITNNDIHVIDTIGVDEPKNMSTVAKKMAVTVGTLTIAINNLVKKGYVLRVRSTEDRRVVLLSLSAKGVAVYKANLQFRKEMIHAAVEGFDEEQCRIVEKALTNLQTFFKEHT